MVGERRTMMATLPSRRPGWDMLVFCRVRWSDLKWAKDSDEAEEKDTREVVKK